MKQELYFALLIAMLGFGPTLVAYAGSCDRVVIARYIGTPKRLGDIYYERENLKFWDPDWSPRAIELSHPLKERWLTKELTLSVDPCNHSAWLYPPLEGKKAVRVGKLKERYEQRIPDPRQDDPLLLRVLTNEWVRDGVLHLLFHFLGG